MKNAFGLALGVAAASVASTSELEASGSLRFAQMDRSGIERVDSRPMAGKRGTELGKKPKSGSEMPDGKKSQPNGGEDAGPRAAPEDPPGCVFTKKPLKLIV
jgi:hypothetical protein